MRLTANALRVDFAHVTVAQQAVVGHAQEAHGMRLEIGHLFRFFEVVSRGFIQVKVALVALAQENNFLITRQIARVAVFADVGREDGVGLFLGVVIHHIAGHGRNMMFAPHILAALAVVIEERLAVLVERHAAHRHGHYLLGPTAFGAHLVEFGNPARGKLHILSPFHHLGREIDFLPIGRESQRHLGGRVGRNALRHTAFGRNQIHIEIAVAVGSKGDLLAVGRPNRFRIVSGICGDLQGFAARGVHHIHIAFVSKGNLVAIGRNHIVTQPQRLGGKVQACRQNES